MKEVFGMFVEAAAIAIMIPAVICVIAITLFMLVTGV
jgi:hypothetical protein